MEKLRFILTKNEIHFLIPYPSKNAIRGWVVSLQNKLKIANLVRVKKAQNEGVKSSIKPVKLLLVLSSFVDRVKENSSQYEE